MLSFLSSIFVHKDASESERRKEYVTLCGVLGIVLNVLLSLIKGIAGVLTGSIAIVADAVNNLSDAGSSFVTLIGFKMAAKEADTDHPFGHGRFEYISGFVVSIAIILMGFEIGKSAFVKIFHPQEIDAALVSVLVLIISIIVKFYMYFYNSRVGKLIDSPAMKATAMDSISDMLSTMVVLASVLLFRFTGLNLDAYCGLAVAGFILYCGYMAARDTLSPLLGNPPTREFVEKIENIVMSHESEGIIGIHDMVVHDYGPGRVMLSLHAEVPGDQNIYKLHEVIDSVEKEIKKVMNCEAVIHMDPIDLHSDNYKEIKQLLEEIFSSLEGGISFHDLRIVPGEKDTNIIFDMVVPYGTKLTPKEAKEKVRKAVEKANPAYHTVIEIDRDYVR